jgi:hypothetical protein
MAVSFAPLLCLLEAVSTAFELIVVGVLIVGDREDILLYLLCHLVLDAPLQSAA